MQFAPFFPKKKFQKKIFMNKYLGWLGKVVQISFNCLALYRKPIIGRYMRLLGSKTTSPPHAELGYKSQISDRTKVVVYITFTYLESIQKHLGIVLTCM